jgi:parvulin-like peptidyl-prolyl isomerase
MSRLFYQKKVFPRIEVTAEQIRRYYDEHRDRDFTEHGTARFRLIKIDARNSGGREQARAKILDLRNRITKAGEAFSDVARMVNDDPRLRRTGGDLGAAIQKGAFANEKVEQAVWQTPVGQVTPIVDAGDAFYIALVEEKTPGRVLPFESDEVQSRIRFALENEQFRTMRRQMQEQLMRDAIVRSDQNMLDIAVTMAMENYPRWAHAAG